MPDTVDGQVTCFAESLGCVSQWGCSLKGRVTNNYYY